MKRWMMAMLCLMLVVAAGCTHSGPDGPTGSAATSASSETTGNGPSGENGHHGEKGETAAPGASGRTDEPSPSRNGSESEPADRTGTEIAEGKTGGTSGAPGTEIPYGAEELYELTGAEPFRELKLVKTDRGFELQGDAQESPTVLQTLISPPRDGKRLVVQIARRTTSDGRVTRFRKDAVVLDFAGRSDPVWRVFPLFEAYVNDDYYVDSVTEAYGFLDADRLLHVAASGNNPATGNFSYRVQTLDIRTRAIGVLFPDIPGAPMNEFFGRGWLTADKGTLVLNTYQTGKLWTFDLGKREVRQSKRFFPHVWPFYHIVPSPDGELFWYMDHRNRKYRLHRADGEPVAQAAFPSGYDEYPPFEWTPDGRYAAYAYTRDKSDDHILDDNGEVAQIAPQGIRFFDRRRNVVLTVETAKGSGEYVELAAWIDDGREALLHFFKLDRSNRQPGEPPEKMTLRYERLRIPDGERTALKRVEDPAQLERSVYVPQRPNGSLYRIDDANNRIFMENGFGIVVPDDTSAQWAWYTEEGEDAILGRFDSEQGVVSAQKMKRPDRWPDAVVHDWLVAGPSYIRIAPLPDK